MAEHFCKEHHTQWFKTGKMKTYAHPILDGDGNPIKENGKQIWCNEPEKEERVKSESQTQEHWDDYNAKKQKSIERQASLERAIEWANQYGQKMSTTDILLAAEIFYQWISQGTIPSIKEATKSTETQKDTSETSKAPPDATTTRKGTEPKHIPDPLKGQLIKLAENNEAWRQRSLIAKLDRLSATKTPSKSSGEAYYKLNESGIKDFMKQVEEALKKLEHWEMPGDKDSSDIPF